jgi:hypothetical protein
MEEMEVKNWMTDMDSFRILEFRYRENTFQLSFRTNLMSTRSSVVSTEEIKHMLMVPSRDIMVCLIDAHQPSYYPFKGARLQAHTSIWIYHTSLDRVTIVVDDNTAMDQPFENLKHFKPSLTK